MCTDGACAGPIECEAGWGDRDGDASNECEANLESDNNCGACNEPCSAGPHIASVSCDAGKCTMACEDPWEDCNDDAADGCEIPTGVPNRCDTNGLNADNGCWTAHCGQSSNLEAVNFAAWFCDCADTPDDCLCVVDEVSYLDQVCEP